MRSTRADTSQPGSSRSSLRLNFVLHSDQFARHTDQPPNLRPEEIQMKTKRMTELAVLIVGIGLALNVARAQLAGTKRTDLQRHDLSVAGCEVVQVPVDIDPGVVCPRHMHPGQEIIYVLEGLLEYQVEGKPPVTLKAGDVLFIPA